VQATSLVAGVDAKQHNSIELLSTDGRTSMDSLLLLLERAAEEVRFLLDPGHNMVAHAIVLFTLFTMTLFRYQSTSSGASNKRVEFPDEVGIKVPPPNTTQWLHHCIEVETSFKYHERSRDDHQAALDAILADTRNNVNKSADVHVAVSVLDEHEAFDFDSVHHLPLPIEVEHFPLVLMMVYKIGANKCFAKVKVDLTEYDGVAALHAAFNMLEYLETGCCSPYPFKGTNAPLPEHQFENFEKQLSRIYWGKIWVRLSSAYWLGLWRRSPLMGSLEPLHSVRPALRYTEVSVSFKSLMSKIDQAKELLGIPFYAVTVNYSPSIALSICPSLDEVKDKKKRTDCITFPPVGTGPPPPMNAAHIEAIFNTIFLNNYGKHEAPKISGKVVGYTWDWSGFLTMFPPFFMVIQIQDKLFFSMSGPPSDMETLLASGIFDDVGKSKEFRHRSFYVRGE